MKKGAIAPLQVEHIYQNIDDEENPDDQISFGRFLFSGQGDQCTNQVHAGYDCKSHVFIDGPTGITIKPYLHDQCVRQYEQPDDIQYDYSYYKSEYDFLIHLVHLNDSHSFSNSFENVNCEIQIFFSMRCADHASESSGSFRYGRKYDSGNKNTFFKQRF